MLTDHVIIIVETLEPIITAPPFSDSNAVALSRSAIW